MQRESVVKVSREVGSRKCLSYCLIYAVGDAKHIAEQKSLRGNGENDRPSFVAPLTGGGKRQRNAPWELHHIYERVTCTPDGCHLWTGSKNQFGYGQIHFGGRHLTVHRLVYTLAVGPIPEGLTLDHLCKQRACVNPGHLEPCTLRENLSRGDGFGATNSRKTHCVNGHELAEDNLYRGRGKRECRICRRAYSAAYVERRRTGKATRSAA